MTMTHLSFRSLVSLLALGVVATSLSGCFIFLGDDDDDEFEPDPIVNVDPEILDEETWWRCDLDTDMEEYFFEFQAVVDDLDGIEDVEFVDVTVFDADLGTTLESFTLINEGAGVWGGLVWETESSLFCGEPIDVMFEAWDVFEGYDSLTLYYY